MASWLQCSTPERAVRVQALDGRRTYCCVLGQDTLTVSLSTQAYKMGTGKVNAGGTPAID